jgi:hypothetical protein
LQTTSESGTNSVVSGLLRRVASSALTPDHNGLWTCRENGVAEEAVSVGLYQRGGGEFSACNRAH